MAKYNTTNGLCECGCGNSAPIATRTYTKRGIIAGQPMRFLPQHQGLKSPFEYTVSTNGCWLWQRAITTAGYGSVRFNGETAYAHRMVYERHKGPITPGLVLDHLCRNPACVNPDHLEPVSQRENIIRGDAP